MTTLLYVARHAEAGHTGDDPDLTTTGQDQARRLGQRIHARGARIAAVHHSPLRRARHTAHLAGQSLPGVPVIASEHLSDRTPVPEPGREDEYPARYGSFDDVPEGERDPGGTRIQAAFEHFADLARAGGPDETHLLITHAFVVGWFVRHALDAPAWRWLGLNAANAALTIIRLPDDGPPTLLTYNSHGAI
jgi:probable phosphoglycerate mutase